MDCSPPDSSVHGISQVKMLEWVGISFSRGCSGQRIKPMSPALVVILYHWAILKDTYIRSNISYAKIGSIISQPTSIFSYHLSQCLLFMSKYLNLKKKSHLFFTPSHNCEIADAIFFQSSSLKTWELPFSLVAQSCWTLCDSMDCSPPGSFVPWGFSRQGLLEWLATPSSRGSSQLRDRSPGLPHCSQILYLLYCLSH